MSRIKNISRSGWLVTGVVAALLLVPTAATAVAVTSIVTIKGGTAAGQASVTGANQLLTSAADPKAFVNAFSGTATTCSAGGFYTVPAGKALIITAVNFYFGQPPTSGEIAEELFDGASATPCSTLVTSGVSAAAASQNQVFQPGVAVPAGDSLGWEGLNVNGSVQVYGYLVPSTAVAAATIHGIAPGSRGHSPTVIR
jgi:hypothetical protein